MKIHVTRFRAGPDAGPVIDMTPDGQFVDRPPEASSDKLARFAALVAVVAGMVAVTVLVLWIAMALIPLAIIGGVVAYVALRWHQWRGGSSLTSRPPHRP